MRWLRILSGLAVLYVLCLAIGGLLGLIGGGLLGSAAGPAAVVTLAVVLVGILIVAALSRRRSTQWRSNPYW
ncbi:MAG: hypothetical protein ABEH64_04690 [Salinirussus sp.]